MYLPPALSELRDCSIHCLSSSQIDLCMFSFSDVHSANNMRVRVSQENKIFDLTLPTLITFVPRSKKFKKNIFGLYIATGFDGLGGIRMESEKSEFFF